MDSPTRSSGAPAAGSPSPRPRLGFLGLGWIGGLRLEALVGAGCAEVVALADPSREQLAKAAALAPRAATVTGLDELLEHELDGLVVATPSALHAEQVVTALRKGLPVFCQKPLARNADEAALVLAAARAADRLVAVDFCYRQTAAMVAIRDQIASGKVGEVYAIDLAFHNAYGPDKPWFRDPDLSGGGCLIDLGSHLVDLALWVLGFPEVERAEGRLFANGQRLARPPARTEDFAVAQLDLEAGPVIRLACSWNLAAGQQAVIEAHFHGSNGGLSWRNVDGSFFDFVAQRHDGTSRTVLTSPPDAWGGRTLEAWARRIAVDPRHDGTLDQAVAVAQVLDRIYGRMP